MIDNMLNTKRSSSSERQELITTKIKKNVKSTLLFFEYFHILNYV